MLYTHVYIINYIAKSIVTTFNDVIDNGVNPFEVCVCVCQAPLGMNCNIHLQSRPCHPYITNALMAELEQIPASRFQNIVVNLPRRVKA